NVAILRLVISTLALLAFGTSLHAQTISLEASDQLKLVNVKTETVTFKGRKALKAVDAAPAGTGDEGRMIVLTKTDFQDGVIEIDLAGEPGAGPGEGARGFVGVAFRVNPDQ